MRDKHGSTPGSIRASNDACPGGSNQLCVGIALLAIGTLLPLVARVTAPPVGGKTPDPLFSALLPWGWL